MDTWMSTKRNQLASSVFVSIYSLQRNPLHFTPQYENSKQRTSNLRRFVLAVVDCEVILGSYAFITLVRD